MKLKELAEAMEIKSATLSQNLAKDNPKPSTFVKLGKAFKMLPTDLENLYREPERYEIVHIKPIMMGDANQEIELVVRDIHENHKFLIDSESDGNLFVEPITATFNYKGTQLYADSLQDIKDITNIISSLESMDDAEQKQSMLSLLIKQYGNWMKN